MFLLIQVIPVIKIQYQLFLKFLLIENIEQSTIFIEIEIIVTH